MMPHCEGSSLDENKSENVPALARRAPLTKRGEQTFNKILDASRKLLEEKGYSKFTTNHAAREAGVSIGTLYQYFPNKEVLLCALTERWYQSLNEEFDRSLSDPNLQDDIYSAIRAVYVNTLNQQYAHYIAYEEVDKAAAHIPELTKLKDEHTQQFSLRLRKLFEKFGYCNEAKKLEDLSAFLYQVAVMMLRLTALSSGETRELRAELSLRIVDELVKAAVELAQ